jgi:quinol monooxygenase YgiN
LHQKNKMLNPFHLLALTLLSLPAAAQANPKPAALLPAPMKNVGIDRFTVPAAAVAEFRPRLKVAGQQLCTQPGLVRYSSYESTAADGQLVLVTVAVWANEQAIQAAHQRAGGNLPSCTPGCTSR